jgi:sugar/nucleoside kinase (ribokinase family)
MQLLGAEQPTSREAIARFGKVEAKAGGSASNTGSSLAAAGVSVSVVAKIGNDLHGDEMMRQWQAAGMHTELVSRDEGLSTSTAVLPVYTDGGRGCWIDLSANDALNADAVLAALAPSRPTASSPDEHQPEQAPAAPPVAAVHIGYPHLLQSLRGAVLSSLFDALSRQLDGVLLSVDVNGVSPDSEEDVLGPAMWGIDLLHANMEEARIIAFAGGSDAEDDEAAPTSSQSGDAEAAEEPSSLEDDLPELRRIADQMHRRGVAVLGVTLGSRGAFVSAHPDQARLRRVPQLDRATAGWCGADLLLPSPPVRGSVNANGAGDAFTAGMLASLIRQEPGSLEEALREAQESARRRISGEDAPKE